MSSNTETTNLNLNSTKSSGRPSNEALQTGTGDATDAGKTEQEKMDRVADESALRSSNRIHAEEEKNPEDTLFTK